MKPEISIKPADVILTAIFLHGFSLHGIDNVVPGGWSIASEAIFYLIFPFILKYVKDLKRSIVFLVISFALALINLTVGRMFEHKFPSSKDLIEAYIHFDFLMNIPAFATGVLIYHLGKCTSFTWKPSNIVFYTVIFVFLVFCSFGYSIPFSQLVAVLFLGFIAWAISVKHRSIFTNRAFSYLGEISFSIYLVHFVILSIGQTVAPLTSVPIENLAILYIFTFTISVAVATITYKFIEVPMIAVGKKITPKGRASYA
jgi:peptidoglycan/LPS O-acetylase OafA/YrhL